MCALGVSTLTWWVTLAVMAAFLTVDLWHSVRKPHVPQPREAARHLLVYVGLAVLFGLLVWRTWGGEYAGEYYAGWLTEYSLSVDNLFVFLLIMQRFSVPAHLQQNALLAGILIAIVLRAVFIAAGAAAIQRFSWVFYVFGVFLIATSVKLAREGESDDDGYHENRLLQWVERKYRFTNEFVGTRLVAEIGGVRQLTAMALVILSLGTTDLLFALDSIPAIYGLTNEPYLVLTANVFALMGLRQLYFLIGGLLKRLVYLSVGLAVLLAFIGVKLVLHALHENELPFINGGRSVAVPQIPIAVSLGAIVTILGVATVASLWRSNRDTQSLT